MVLPQRRRDRGSRSCEQLWTEPPEAVGVDGRWNPAGIAPAPAPASGSIASPASLARSSMETSHPALPAPGHRAPGHSACFTAAVGSCCFPLSHYNSILMRLPPARLPNRRLHVSARGWRGDIWVLLVCSWECLWTQKRGEKKRKKKSQEGQANPSL